MNNPQTHRRCPRCETIKLVGDFYKVGRGYSGYCKPCQKEYTKALPRYRESVERSMAKRQLQRREAGAKPALRLSPEERMAREMWRNAHKRSTNLRREATLTYERVVELVTEFTSTHEFSSETLNPFKPSLDRIDNSKGYHDDNVRIVWFMHNMARGRFDDADVLEFCHRFIAQYTPPTSSVDS